MGQATRQATGELREGIVCLVMGSSTIIIDAVREPQLDPRRRYLLTPHARAGLVRAGDGSAGDGQRLSLAGPDPGLGPRRDRAPAAGSVPGARGLSSRPISPAASRGAVGPEPQRRAAGAALHHGAGDIARAFLEGVHSRSAAASRCWRRPGPSSVSCSPAIWPRASPACRCSPISWAGRWNPSPFCRRPLSVRPCWRRAPARFGARRRNLTQASRRARLRGNTMSSTGAIARCFRAWLHCLSRSDDGSAMDR